jgi:hypothetical protein
MSQSWSCGRSASRAASDFWGVSNIFAGCFSWSWVNNWAFSENFMELE